MELTQWVALAHRASQAPQDEKHKRDQLLASAIKRGAFWGLSDAQVAWEAMFWIASQQGLGKQFKVQWERFVSHRVTVVRAHFQRGLDEGAFRHPRHAWNALAKLRRTGVRDKDFLDAWESEVQRRLSCKVQPMSA